MMLFMFAGRPVIGIAGGIGSGKSFVASLFGQFGCLVVNSDDQVTQAYRDPSVKETLRHWWGDEMIAADGDVNRKAIADKVFNDINERRRLEALIHPLVNEARRRVMSAAAMNPKIPAFVWDTPLLFEASLNLQCDAVVFVDAPVAQRLQRVQKTRNWTQEELISRENSQWPLDKKREISDYVIRNTADAGEARRQVKDVLSRIMSKASLRA
jgi:dephospho-CoA kinase